MKREWKPGDIAILRDSLLEWPAVKDVRGWSALAPHIGWVSDGDRFTVVRPLVVIDPEDREQVERLLVAYQAQYQHPSAEVERRTSKLQAALREFANPTPPKPDEPTGHYAVVEDEAGQEWCRIDPCNGYVWQLLGQPSGQCRYAEWKHIAAVRVLSEGVAS